MHNWSTINEALAEFEKQGEPESVRDKLIHKARLRKLREEYDRENRIATIASSMKMLKESAPSGDLYISLPDYDIEVRVEW
jgi:hypothetical protein